MLRFGWREGDMQEGCKQVTTTQEGIIVCLDDGVILGIDMDGATYEEVPSRIASKPGIVQTASIDMSKASSIDRGRRLTSSLQEHEKRLYHAVRELHHTAGVCEVARSAVAEARIMLMKYINIKTKIAVDECLASAVLATALRIKGFHIPSCLFELCRPQELFPLMVDVARTLKVTFANILPAEVMVRAYAREQAERYMSSQALTEKLALLMLKSRVPGTTYSIATVAAALVAKLEGKVRICDLGLPSKPYKQTASMLHAVYEA